jgi:tetratricopeptide (TPR) repeat protein
MEQSNHKRKTMFICLGLALAVLLAYLPIWQCGFVDFDDGDYVRYNDMIKRGLSWPGITWAFTTFHSSNWHPLTWLSYLLDFQLFGLNPTAFHATNLLLHLANSILLFLIVQRMTKAMWRSALVAAIFALHPLHVESVAWISERKDVLSAFFWMLTIWAYVRFAEPAAKAPVPDHPHRNLFYGLSLVFFALGLMAKSMLVTLPFVLLLLDYWPLGRLRAPIRPLVQEKIPFFALAALASWVSFLAQRHGGAVAPLTLVPLGARLANVPVSYVRYIAKTIWPAHLAVLYLEELHWSPWIVIASCVLLILVTLLVIGRGRAQPYLPVGWFWFLGTLVPVIGLIQIGEQSIADRYHYLPGIGLSIMFIWAAAECLPRLAAPLSSATAAAILGGCACATWLQVHYWTSSTALFGHAVEVTKDNAVMESNLGKALFHAGRLDEAIPHLENGAALAPGIRGTHFLLGQALLAKGRLAEALDQYEFFVNLKPDDPNAQYDFGNVLLEHGQTEESIGHFEKAIQLQPRTAEFHYKLANACSQVGRTTDAIREYNVALQIQPDHVQACNNLAWILASNPDASLRNGPTAVTLAERAEQLSRGENPVVLGTLAVAYANVGNFTRAIATAQRALDTSIVNSNSPFAAALRAQISLYQTGTPFRDTPPTPQGAASPTKH